MVDEREAAPGESVMEGGGFYSEHSGVQHSAAAPGYPMLERAASVVPLPSAGPVLIADMGCAGGRNEMDPLRRAIDGVRARDADVPIVVVHTDLPSNDWATLFALVEESDDSYLTGQHNVYAYAAGRSLYGAIVPDRSMHLGWSGITVHWLSNVPVVVRDTIYANLTTGDTRAALAEQSRVDWESFLRERARELDDGGQVVVVGGASHDDGMSGAEGLFSMADAQLRGMVDGGQLRQSEYEHIFYPTWNRSRADFLAPLEGDGEFADTLSVEEVVDDQTSDAWTYPRYERDGDAAGFAAAYIGFVRAITEPSFFRWLEPDRSADDRSKTTETFYAGLHERIAADPQSATCHWCTVSLRIARRPR
jgi:SAM dependent carboxyl methyltransferase